MMILKRLATRMQLSDESRAYLNTTTIALSLVHVPLHPGTHPDIAAVFKAPR